QLDKNTISCQSPGSLIFDGKSLYGKSVTCSESGWKDQDGKFVWEHSSQAAIERDLDAACRRGCDPKNRLLDKRNGLVEDQQKNELMCSGDRKAIKIIFTNDGSTTTIGRPIKCVEGVGWEEVGTGVTFMKFNQQGTIFHAECVDSCTQAVIENYIWKTCPVEQFCSLPTMDNAHMIQCKDETMVLYHKEANAYLKGAIECDTLFFKHETNSLRKFDRKTQTQKIEAVCIPKCDTFTVFATGSNDPTAKNYIEEWVDNRKRMVKCTEDDHILKMNDQLSPESGTCYPDFGWKTSAGEEVLGAKFTDPNYKITLDCINACHDRVEKDCTKDARFCENFIKPDGINSYSCPETHLMRVNNGKTELLNQELKCTREGMRKKDGSVVHKFEPIVQINTKFGIECVSKCHEDFLKKVSGNFDYTDLPKKETIKCRGLMDVMEINNKRVFGQLECDA
ncbi:hypothetical protein PMAYCL1PPCAC_19432, partial [Pristionchus mayeri]